MNSLDFSSLMTSRENQEYIPIGAIDTESCSLGRAFGNILCAMTDWQEKTLAKGGEI